MSQKRKRIGGFCTASEHLVERNATVGGDSRRSTNNVRENAAAFGGFCTAGEYKRTANNDGQKETLPSEKSSSLPTFCTAKEFKDMNAIDDMGAAANQKRPAFAASAMPMPFKSDIDSTKTEQTDCIGFRTAGENTVVTATRAEIDAAASVLEGTKSSLFPSKPTTTSTNYTIHLKCRGIKYHKENLQSLDSITLEREPENEYDTNAICVKNGEGDIVGHIAKEQAAALAPVLDSNIISLQNVSMKDKRDATLLISADAKLLDETKREHFRTEILPKIIGVKTNPKEYRKLDMINEEAVQQLAQGITAQDAATATTCQFDILQTKNLPWKKNPDGSAAAWPPSQDYLDSLETKFGGANEEGYGKVDDVQWWQEHTGLNPPSMWDVQGALDLLPNVSISSDQKNRASDALDDAVHGVPNAWSEQTLKEIRDLMHAENFWNFRSGGE